MSTAERGVAAVVFDLDGVLIDSEPVWEQVRHDLVDEYGGRWPADAQTQLMGMNTQEWARYLSEDLGVGLPSDQVATVVIDRMAARYAQQLPLIPGADSALRRIAARWRLGLASSSPRRLIDSVLAAAGWDALFEATVSTEEVARGKPAPDVYQTVIGQLGLPATACVAIEDSSNGLRSAAAAGLLVIAVPRPRYPPAPDALARAATQLTSLDDLTVASIERTARQG
ncbi:HAD family hydrolase [Kribbella sp. NPDC004875]|uniref:HAD family hydrolase n=1 Tax=Kribbella sp. NPDC004875 TaxID=3364107 RepID=UPI00369FA55F